jgi:hypothetical protein
MRSLKWAVLPVLVLVLAGCVHVNDTSGHANVEQIRDHLVGVIHCKDLEFMEDGKDRFFGKGRNDTGDFTITAERDGETIKFKGVYLPPARGTFSGSMSWRKQFNAGFGFTKSKEASETSIGAP